MKSSITFHSVKPSLIEVDACDRGRSKWVSLTIEDTELTFFVNDRYDFEVLCAMFDIEAPKANDKARSDETVPNDLDRS